MKNPRFTRAGAAAFLMDNAVPLLFVLISAVAIPFSGFSAVYLIQELLVRLARNSFLVLALLVPIMAGMGLNFGMTLGAMAGEIGLLFVINHHITGVHGVALAMLLSVPLSALVGWLTGIVLNKAKGREMVTSFILAFFANGIYQLMVLYGMGSIIPVGNPALVLSRGYGIRNAVNLVEIRQALDNLILVRLGPFSIPLVTVLVITGMCLFILLFRRTKLGQDMRAVGGDMAIAEAAGIDVERTRTLSIVISTVLAGIGMIVYLQNVGTLNTYNSHEQVGMFSIAALLVGGASVSRAGIANVFLGVCLFHLMFIISPTAGKNLIGSAMLGEYFRVFISYGVISVALVLYALHRQRGRAGASPGETAGGGES